MTNNNFKVLITRPEKSGRTLQSFLSTQGIEAHCQPFFDYQLNADNQQLLALQNQLNHPIIVFISVAAVEFAHQIMPLNLWQNKCIIAVGTATQIALKSIGLLAYTPEKHDSDGLLALPQLQDVQNQDVIIVRGNGGRELIAQELTLRGANVHYFESYRRIWRNYSQDLLESWRKKQINCIVVTSNALLQSVVSVIEHADDYWKEDCQWVVASARILDNAKEFGIRHVFNANGASDSAILTALNHA